MRGVVFTELLEFIEENLGFDVLDQVIEKASLANEAVFTQGGNYSFDDLLALIVALSEISGKEIPELLEIFGEHMFGKLALIYGRDIKDGNDILDFIDSIENLVHVEVKKLYPDADLPTFTTISKKENELTMIYQSEKKLENFAVGLMKGCSKRFKQPLDIKYEKISESPYKVKFVVRKI